MKGNINMVNEMLDNITTRDELKGNDIVIEMMKSLKEGAPKLVQTIEETVDEEDVMNCCMIVNDDIQKTFSRFRAIKENKKPDEFVPGEYTNFDTLQFLEPTHFYKQDQ